MADPYFNVDLLACTPNPQQLIWQALHTDYSEDFISLAQVPPEDEAGRIAVKRLLAGERGHYGPLEHPQITLACGWFPHSVMQQARTHRVGISFDVQSGRYTSDRILKVASDERPVEEVFYLRPVGQYHDREGKNYTYTKVARQYDLDDAVLAARAYAHKIGLGYSEEHARGLLPFDIRQHFVVSFTLRSLLHFLDLRSKADAQLEIQQLCDLMVPHLQSWVPEIAEWYVTKRLHKAKLAP